MSIPSYCQLNADYRGYGSRSLESYTAEEQAFIVATDIDTLVETNDPDADYSYDDYALCKTQNQDDYYIINTSGCSCPSPSDTWGIVLHGSAEDVREWFSKQTYGQYCAAVTEFARETSKVFDIGIPVPEHKSRYDW